MTVNKERFECVFVNSYTHRNYFCMSTCKNYTEGQYGHCKYVSMYVCMYLFIYLFIYIYAYLCRCKYKYIHIYAFMYVMLCYIMLCYERNVT